MEEGAAREEGKVYIDVVLVCFSYIYTYSEIVLFGVYWDGRNYAAGLRRLRRAVSLCTSWDYLQYVGICISTTSGSFVVFQITYLFTMSSASTNRAHTAADSFG